MMQVGKHTQKHLARIIEVVDASGIAHRYTMTIATVTVANGLVADVETELYVAECEGVRYHDDMFRIVVGKPLPPDWQC